MSSPNTFTALIERRTLVLHMRALAAAQAADRQGQDAAGHEQAHSPSTLRQQLTTVPVARRESAA